MNPTFEMLEQALGRLHPAFVHFPIALFLVAGMLELGNLRGSKPSRVALVCLGFGVVGAALAAYSGWERAEFDGPGSSLDELLFRHRWCAIGSAVCALLALIAGNLAERAESAGKLGFYRVALFLSAGLVSYVGFLGGEMVYGVGYVTEVFEQDHEPEVQGSPDVALPETASSGVDVEEPEPIVVEDPGPVLVDYATQILPIFERVCYECHGPTGKSRGGLRLHERETLFYGDEEFWIIVPENAEDSYLMELISLPAGDPDLMPKDGDPLPLDEIKLLRAWINQGAHWE